MELVTSVVILPQRQTVLVAKQAAEIDLLTQGKLRLGVGLGWNEVESEALGQNVSDRGARLTEQVAVLRRLWTETSVTVARGNVGSTSSSSIDQQIAAWREAGATHLSINTMRAGFTTVDEHIAALTSASEAALS